jgi:hypothetical protein
MKIFERTEALDFRRFVGTAAMIAAAAELGIVPSFTPQLRPVPVKAIAKVRLATRDGNRL